MNLLAEEAAEAPNVLAVPLDELILGIVAFLIVFWLLSKLALPGIRKALEERTASIEGGLERAATREAEANALYEQYQAQLAEARTEAAQIRAQAQSDKLAIVDEARTEATEAAAVVTARADAAITAERASTIASLRSEVGTLALTLAGKVVGESLEDDARARATVDRFIADLEAQAAGR
jgi:F-type H+-transporting ATPase subunit b